MGVVKWRVAIDSNEAESDRVDSEHNLVERDTNRVNVYHNRVDSEAEHNRVKCGANQVGFFITIKSILGTPTTHFLNRQF